MTCHKLTEKFRSRETDVCITYSWLTWGARRLHVELAPGQMVIHVFSDLDVVRHFINPYLVDHVHVNTSKKR